MGLDRTETKGFHSKQIPDWSHELWDCSPNEKWQQKCSVWSAFLLWRDCNTSMDLQVYWCSATYPDDALQSPVKHVLPACLVGMQYFESKNSLPLNGSQPWQIPVPSIPTFSDSSGVSEAVLQQLQTYSPAYQVNGLQIGKFTASVLQNACYSIS